MKEDNSNVLFMYSVFDRLALEYGPPFVAKNDAVAVRAYKHLLRDASADDFWLCKIATFDVATAEIIIVPIVTVDVFPNPSLEVKNG